MKEYAAVIKTRWTEADPDVADLVYRYTDQLYSFGASKNWYYAGTLEREVCLELVEDLNYLENRGWEEQTETYTSSDAAEIGQSIF